MSSISTDFVKNQSLNGDYSVDEYQNEELGSPVGVDVDIKFELPRHQSVQLLTDQDQDEVDLESWVMMNAGGDGAAECLSMDMDTVEDQPVSELKDPLDIGEEVSVEAVEFKPEVKTNAAGSSSSALFRQAKPKLKQIKTAICTKCNIGFPSPFLFEQHMIQVHQDDRPYPCKFCGKPFAHRTELKCHEAIHDPNRFKGEPQFACNFCGKRYHIKGSMEAHRKKFHLGYKPPKNSYKGPVKEHHSTSGVRNPNPYRKPKEIFPCPHCDLTFEMKCTLRKHMIVHTRERPFSCPICQQPFPKETQVKTHIRTVHQSATPSGLRHPRPKWQANQPCPCTTCGKIFPTPCQLENHILLHTGEKPHVCSTCGEKFRMKQTLNHHIKRNHIQEKIKTNPLKLYKCRICGKDDFILFSDLNRHRQTCHRHIPFDSENEKSFGCGICGKPFYLREGALICALLGHDPTSLRKAMFKHKCSECPSHFGFHNLTFLRRHWEEEHQDKQLPVQFRVGMYSKNLKANELPTLTIDKVKKEEIKLNGPPPPSKVKSEMALYTEFDLLPIPEEERFFKKGVHQVVYGYKFKCTICGYHAATLVKLGKHVEFKHATKGKMTRKEKTEHICAVCGLKLARAGNLRRHMIAVHGPSRTNKVIRRVGRPRKLEAENRSRRNIAMDLEETDLGTDVIVKTEPVEINEDDDGYSNGDYEDERVIPRSSMFKCRFCARRFPKIQPMRMHELRMHVKPWSTSKNKKCVEKFAQEIPEELGGKLSTSFHGDDNADHYGKGGSVVVNIGDTAAVQAILNFQSVQVQLTRLVDRVEIDEGDDKVEFENELSDKLSHELVNNVGGDDGREDDEVSGKTYKYILGNKELKIVLDRVDQQDL